MRDSQSVVCCRARLDGIGAGRVGQAEIRAGSGKIHNLWAARGVVSDGESATARAGSGRCESDLTVQRELAAKVAGQLLV